MTDPASFSTEFTYERQAMRPTARTWIIHIALLLITLCTTTIAGVLFPFGTKDTFPSADPQTWNDVLQFVMSIPVRYTAFVASVIYDLLTNFTLLKEGLSFSISLLFILLSHEMGHYIACRIYGVDATLPFFIPTPPLIGPAGTFGAFIKIQSPMPSRKAVFDIGVAGPIAGFIALIPIAIIGLATVQTLTPEQAAHYQSPIVFFDPLFIKGVAYFFGIDTKLGLTNPFSCAAWVGLLVTALKDRKSTRLNSSHIQKSRMPSSA